MTFKHDLFSSLLNLYVLDMLSTVCACFPSFFVSIDAQFWFVSIVVCTWQVCVCVCVCVCAARIQTSSVLFFSVQVYLQACSIAKSPVFIVAQQIEDNRWTHHLFSFNFKFKASNFSSRMHVRVYLSVSVCVDHPILSAKFKLWLRCRFRWERVRWASRDPLRSEIAVLHSTGSEILKNIFLPKCLLVLLSWPEPGDKMSSKVVHQKAKLLKVLPLSTPNRCATWC